MLKCPKLNINHPDGMVVTILRPSLACLFHACFSGVFPRHKRMKMEKKLNTLYESSSFLFFMVRLNNLV